MPTDPLKKGPTGETVRANIIRLRAERNLGYTELSERLKDLDRHILPLGLRRIEAGERRVDADDLVALAVALDVSPATLLMPNAATGDELVEVTGVNEKLAAEGEKITAEHLWEWLRCRQPIVTDEHGYQTFWPAQPAWVQQRWRERLNLDEDNQPIRKAK
jgi:transcriptional regulator with XRE-family HTH domain